MDDKNALVTQNRNETQMMMPVTQSQDKYGYVEALVRSDMQARVAVAMARPRDYMDVRSKLLKDAARPGFAEVAEFNLPRGGKSITGPTIRFAENALRAMTNVVCDVAIVNEDDKSRLVQVTVADLESNQVYRQCATIQKTIERKQKKDWDEVLSSRMNSDGAIVYTITAPESEVLMKQNSIVSRIIRTLALRIVPGDIIEEALDACRRTRQNTSASDPDAARKRLADAFAALSVRPSDLAGYLGHPLDQSSPSEIDDLRNIWSAIKEGETTWHEVAGKAKESEEKDIAAAAKAKIASRVKPKTEPLIDAKINDKPSEGMLPVEEDVFGGGK